MAIILRSLLLIWVSGFTFPEKLHAYSVLTHEAVIDATWEQAILPLIKQRYPAANDSVLKVARAYAYGGCVAPDMGYYPRSSKLFTDIVHYVRSGDLTRAMLEEATDATEFAFALGWLAHYMSDNYGHPIGVNRATAVIFPKARNCYGDTVTYQEDPVAHVRTELSFDVLQVARGNYAPQGYHDLIGFKVSEPLLKRAFLKTYALNIEDIFPNFDRGVNTFRWAVRDIVPQLTRTAWKRKKAEIRKTSPNMMRRDFVYHMRRADFNNEYGTERNKPGCFAKFIAFVIRVLPKIGPLKKLNIEIPNSEAEQMFVQSFNTVTNRYIAATYNGGETKLTNTNWDTGDDTREHKYALADDTYAALLLRLKDNKFRNVSPELKRNLISFYSTGTNKPEIKMALQELKGLK